MKTYLFKRILLVIPVLFCTVLIGFFLNIMQGGDLIEAKINGRMEGNGTTVSEEKKEIKSIDSDNDVNTVEKALTHFQNYFFSLEDAPARTKKHIASPLSGSTCKRLNMFLRWMVRKDKQGVDFGIWNSVSPAALIMPIDVHVARVSRALGILHRPQTDWQAAIELTNYCRTLDAKDPVKYDFALFSLGVIEKFN